MNRKSKLRIFYKIAAKSKSNDSVRNKILMSLLEGSLLAGGAYQLLKDRAPQQELAQVELKTDTPDELNLVEYEIKKGDNIRSISMDKFPDHAAQAEKYILEANKLDKDSAKKLKVGQKIKIPISLENFVDFFNLEENHSLNVSSSIVDYIKKKETLHEIPKDVEGNGIMTIGFGHRLDTNQKRKEYNDILKILKKENRESAKLLASDPIVLEWLNRDIKEAEDKIKYQSLPSLNQNQFDALVSFVFNTGHLPAIKADLLSGDLEAAASKIRNDKSSTKENFSGLGSRREEEAKLFETKINK